MASEVVVYTTRYCPYCDAAKKLLKDKGVRYREVDVTGDDEAREKLERLTGRPTVPQIIADGKCLGGYTDLVAYFNSGNKL